MPRKLMIPALTHVLALPSAAQHEADTVDPEIAVALPAAFSRLSDEAGDSWDLREAGRPVEAERWMVAAQNPLAAKAGARVLRDGAPVLGNGSPGAAPIIVYTATYILAHLDLDIDVQAAADMPQLVNAFGTYILEEGTWAADLADPLEAMGFAVSSGPRPSSVQPIATEHVRLSGGVDPRREGIAFGQ